jgi:membrane-anchored protein YejM (alkaline phosphatase superfamily)
MLYINSLRLKERLIWFKYFIFFNFFLTFFLGIFYIITSRNVFSGYLFSFFALISNTFLIYIMLGIISFILVLIPFGKLLLIPLFSLIHIANVIDIVLYKFWDFHINSMVINILATPGGIETLNQSWNVKLYFFILYIISFLIEVFIFLLSSKLLKKGLKVDIRKVIIIFIVCVIIDKSVFALSSLYDFIPVTKTREIFPFYQPLTIRRFASKYFGFELKRDIKIIDKNTFLDYPKKELRLKQVYKKYNIIYLVVDSMRYDMLDKDIMPYTWEFSKNAIVFKNHYSGGNTTRFGIFSMFYGIYGNYWFKMVGERRGPLFMELIKKIGYDIKIFATAKLTFPEFTSTCFVDVDKKDIYDEPKGSFLYQRDTNLADKVVEYIKSRSSKNPFFVFVFFDSPHGAYDYPKELEKFNPSYVLNLFKLNRENIKPLFNKYKNSVHFEDHLIKKIIEAIKDSGLYKNTIIVITADHGEAFLERGYTGHNHSFSKEEVSVPLVFYHPDLKPSVVNYRTSHLDLVPTFMKMLGVENEPSDYSHGFGLFEAKWDYIPVFSWNIAALVFDRYTIVMPLATYGGRVRVYDNETWQEIKLETKEYIKYIYDFREKYGRFLKK